MSAEVEVNKSTPEKVEDKSDMGDADNQGDTKKNDKPADSPVKNDKIEQDVSSETSKDDHKDNGENGEGELETPDKKTKDVKEKTKSSNTSKNLNEASDEESGQNSEEDNEKDDDEEEEEEEDDSVDEKNENETKIKSGGREKRGQKRNSEDLAETKEKMDGSGVPLGSILSIDNNLGRAKTDDLKALHKLLYKSPVKSNMIRRNIRKFNGFDFSEDSEQYTTKLDVVNKMDIKQIKSFCDILDIDKKGTKEELANSICEFLLKPKDHNIIQEGGDDNPSGRPKRSAAIKASAKGFSDSEDSDETSQRSVRGKGQRSTLRDDSTSESDYNPSGSDGSYAGPKKATKGKGRGRPARSSTKKSRDYASDESEESEESEEVDSDAPPKKRGRAAKTNKTVSKKSPRSATKKKADSELSESDEESADESLSDDPKPKRGRPPVSNKKVSPSNRGRKAATSQAKGRGVPKRNATNKKSVEKDGSSEESEEDNSESEDEPLSKKGKSQPPTDDELKGLVKKILDGANLEEITMKTVCKQVYAKYPQFDLAHKKEFIKTTVKSLIST